MKGKYTLVFLFFLINTVSFSQATFIVEINRTDGSFIPIWPVIDGVNSIYRDDRAFDENPVGIPGTFIFPSMHVNQLVDHRLYSINTSIGTPIYPAPSIGSILAFEFDNNNNILYGIEQDFGPDKKYFVSINPFNGVSTRIPFPGTPLPGDAAMLPGNFSTFNEIDHYYIFLDPLDRVITIDATTGNVVENWPLSPAGESVGYLTYDNSTGTLYGLLYDSSLGKFFLITIDPATGTIVRKPNSTTFGSDNFPAQGSATIDESSQQYIYLYHNNTLGTIGGYAITTLNIATGDVDYNALVWAVTGADFFNSLKYDQTQGKLFAVHGDTVTTGVEFTAEKPSSFFLGQNYPNPFNPTTTIKYSLPESGFVNLAVYDLLGREVAVLVSKEQSAGKYEINFDASDLVSSVYIYRARVNDFVDSKKMILLR